MAKHYKKTKSLRKIICLIFLIILLLSSYCFIKIQFKEKTDNEKQVEISNALNTIEIEEEKISEYKSERMLQVEKLKEENSDVVGWLEIEGTNINYPVLQCEDNDYYLTHSYKREKVIGGSIFLDKDYDFSIPSSNLLIYGHRNTNGLMFEDLIKYENEEFYKNHPIIRFTTPTEDAQYEIISVFKSRVFYQNEKNVFRYYFFVNASNEEEYNEFVNNAKNISLYDTGKSAEYGDQLLTLSTCEYSQENGRFAIVARKIENN